MENRGKQWEQKFKEQWKECFPHTFLHRLPDQVSGWYGSTNPCDFIAFHSKKLFLLEIKCHKGNTFPFSAFKQYDTLIDFKDYEDIVVGVIVWYEEHNKVVFVPITECERMKNNNCKSINIKMLDEDEYKIIEIPSVMQRVFPKCDYSLFKDL